MGTIAEKLEYLAETKQEIAAAIESKNVSIPEYAAFREYADLIRSILGEGGTLLPVTVTPTGQYFTLYPEDNAEPCGGFSSVSVDGDFNLTPENIAEGISIYGVTGTLKIRGNVGSDVPLSYIEYFQRASELYTGLYDHVMILEHSDYIGVGFLLPGFEIKSYDEETSEFTATGWVYCGYRKANGAWTMYDWSEQTSEGYNFINNIRYCDTVINYNGVQLYPMGAYEEGNNLWFKSIKSLNFSGWDAGSFAGTLEDDTAIDFSVTFNQDGSPSSISGDGNTVSITW